MPIEVHMIQNHSPGNLNRDDLGAPKTCYFGGVLRSRISSQCIKRSIRMSEPFSRLLGGVRTRQLAKLIARELPDRPDAQKRAEKILDLCGFKPKKSTRPTDGDGESGEQSKMLVYTSREAIREMAALLGESGGKKDEELAKAFAGLIAGGTAVPDMALSGRMLEPDKAAKKIWEERETTVEAALQVAHAISTHEARPEIDYYVAADDIPGEDAGAGYVDEAMFASACFYKYFSIDWKTLVDNLKAFGDYREKLAAHTVGAFIRGAALTNPTGRQNSFAAHNPPDGILVEIKEAPISYANAFASPVGIGQRDLISQSIAQLAQYVYDLDTGYGRPVARFWFSPNLRYLLDEPNTGEGKGKTEYVSLVAPGNSFKSFEELIPAVVGAIGYEWEEVQKVHGIPETIC